MPLPEHSAAVNASDSSTTILPSSTDGDLGASQNLPPVTSLSSLPSMDEQAQGNPFMADPNEAAAYLQLLASLQASEAFPGASQF